MLRALSKHSAPFALAGVLWPPFCGVPPWPPGGSGGAAGEGSAGESQAGAGSGGAEAEGGAGGVDSGEAGSSGETAGAAGASAEPSDPVLGCRAGDWPSRARVELLPLVAFDDLVRSAVLRKLSADGEVVIADYGIGEGDDYDLPEGRRPVFWDGSAWQWLDDRALGIPTTVSCDGTVIAGRQSSLDAFIKTAGEPLVVIPGSEPSWAVIPSDVSADGTLIAGNSRNIEPQPTRGTTYPVVWTNRGVANFLDPPELRTIRHLRYDGSLIAGDRNVCSSGMFCGVLSGLFVSPIPFQEALYQDMPWSIMSSDLSTSTGQRVPPIYQEAMDVIALFRIPDQFTELPCPAGSDACEAIALSSHGSILLVNSGSAYVWTAAQGYRSLADLLAADGITFNEPRFRGIDMSDDGRVILGSLEFTNASGEREGHSFRAILPQRVFAQP